MNMTSEMHKYGCKGAKDRFYWRDGKHMITCEFGSVNEAKRALLRSDQTTRRSISECKFCQDIYLQSAELLGTNINGRNHCNYFIFFQSSPKQWSVDQSEKIIVRSNRKIWIADMYEKENFLYIILEPANFFQEKKFFN